MDLKVTHFIFKLHRHASFVFKHTLRVNVIHSKLHVCDVFKRLFCKNIVSDELWMTSLQ